MALAELGFYDSFSPDLLKVMHDIPYEPLPPIANPSDWRKMPILDPEAGNFGLQLETLHQIRFGLNAGVPMIDTVFGVYHYADELSQGRLLAHLSEDPDSVKIGLNNLARSLSAYAVATVEAGCEGIYYALSGASAEGASRETYADVFLELDRLVLDSVAKADINILHLHGYKDLYFDLVHDLPAGAVCWSDRAGGPSLADARAIHSGCLMGGLDETAFENMTPAEITTQGREAIEIAGKRHFILAPGCSVPNNTSKDRLQAIRSAVV
jgi:uroporphyrinogen decarboxylase